MNILNDYSHNRAKNRTSLRAAKVRIKILLIVCPFREPNGSSFCPKITASNMLRFSPPILGWTIGSFLLLKTGLENSGFQSNVLAIKRNSFFLLFQRT